MAGVAPIEKRQQQVRTTGAALVSDTHAHAYSGNDDRLPAFGGELQPGLYKTLEHRKFANPAPLGLCAFALTTFVLSLVNLGARGVTVNSIVVPLAFGYGGFVQFFAGMW